MGNSCLHCGHENRPQAKFCANCGQTLPADGLVTVAPDDSAEHTVSATQAPQAEPVFTAVNSFAPTLPPANDSAPLPTGTTAVGIETLEIADATAPEQAESSEPAIAQNPAPTPAAVLPAEAEPAEPPTVLTPEIAQDQAEASSATTIPAIAAGELIAERYLVLSHTEEGTGQRVYQIEDHGACRSCKVAVQGTEEEPYCFNCGAHLLQSTLPWPVYSLREVEDAPDNPALLTWQGLHFLVESTAASEQGEAKASASASPFPSGVNLLVGQRSHEGVGRVGAPDEDSILTLTLTGVYETKAQPTVGLYVIADGMGGHGDGEVASRITTEAIITALLPTLILPLGQGQMQSADVVFDQIDQAIQTANQRIYEGSRARNNDMGTTLTLALIVNAQAYIANVGDSRTYLWGREGLRQITQDHSYVYTLYKNGALTEEGIYTHPRRNEIYRNLGIGNAVKIDHFQEQLTPGDLLLLCCDGLWEMVHNDGIADVLMLNLGDPQIICDELVNRANVAGGEDNISVVAVRVMG